MGTFVGVDHLEAFEQLLAKREPPLDRAFALIAAHGRPGVDPDRLVAELDALADDLGSRLPDGAGAAELCSTLFGPGGFRGDEEHYHDARNSLLDEVLARRAAIPISLSILAIELGRRVGVEVVGIGLPGHFLVRDARDDRAFFDPFRGGAPMDPTACRALFERLHGPRARFTDGMLAPSPTRQIVTRVLANLRHSYVLESNRAGLVRVVQLQARLPGAGLEERRALAELLAADGRFDEAARLHQELSHLDPDPSQDHAGRALRLLARLN